MLKAPCRYAVLGALLVAATPGAARAQIGPIEVVSSSSAFDSTDFKQAVATCPPGTIAFSGGAEASGSSLGLPVIVHQSLPQGNPPTSWLALAQERTPTAENWQVTSFALCATVNGYQLVDESTPFDSTSPKGLTAECPPGKVPIGGGGGIFVFNPELALYSLTAIDTGWSATAQELTSVAGSWILNVKVSCAPAVDVERFIAYTSNDSEVRDTLILICPANRIAIGGGAYAGGSSIGAMTENRPLVENQALFAWGFGARRVVGSSGWFLESTVLCYLPIVFANGFEAGDTGGWSDTVP